MLAALPVEFRIIRCPSRQAIYIAVVHAKRRGDKDRVVNLQVCGAGLASFVDYFHCHVLPTLSHIVRDIEKRLQLFRQWRVFGIQRGLCDKILVTAEMISGDSAVHRLAIETVIA